MKHLSEKIVWYREAETRRWKCLWHAVELLVIAIAAVAVLVITHIYGDGTKIQPIFTVFTAVLAIASASLSLSLLGGGVFKRWHIQMINLGLGCGVGLSAVTVFLMLELQLVGT